MIHSLSTSLNVYSVHIKQEQKHPQTNRSTFRFDSFFLPPPTERTNQFEIAKQQGEKIFPHLFHTRVFNYEFIQTKISEISLLQQSLAWGAFKPTRQSRRGGAEPQYFRQSALKACYSLFGCLVLFIFCVSNKSRLLEHWLGVFCLLFFFFFFNVHLFKEMKTYENKNKS